MRATWLVVERWPVATAGAAASGAWVGTNVGGWPRLPLLVPVVLLALALALRRPGVVCVAVLVLTGVLGQRSVDGLDAVRPGPVQAEVTLLTDPEPTPGGSVRAEVRWRHRRLSAAAHDSAGAALDDRLAGERILVRGGLEPPERYEQRMRHRHLVGRLRIDTVVGWQAGHAVTRAANGLRRTLEEGAAVLPEHHKALLMGLVLGDERHQTPDLTEAFQTAGLAHLLAVSGQNVAFVTALAAPLTVRLRFGPRLVVTLAVLAGFALLTRGEPSVLRATAMAGTAAFGAAFGRPTSTLRALAVAVAGLLVVDPLLVGSLGFRLSVAGAAGIVVAASPIQARLPGPDWVRAPLAVTLAAQLAVAPLLVAAFGSVAVASLAANLLAIPAAAPLTTWGLTAGVVAGVVGPNVASLLHLPTQVLLWWIELVATTASRWPLGSLQAPHVAALSVAAALALLGWTIRPAADDAQDHAAPFGTPAPPGRPGQGVVGSASGGPDGSVGSVGGRWGMRAWARALAFGVAVLSVGGAVVAPTKDRATAAGTSVAPGVEVWAGVASVVVVDGRASEELLLSELRRRGVDRVDVAVVSTDAARAVEVGRTIRDRWPESLIFAPGAVVAAIPGGHRPDPGASLDLGSWRITFQVGDTWVNADVRARGPPGFGYWRGGV